MSFLPALLLLATSTLTSTLAQEEVTRARSQEELTKAGSQGQGQEEVTRARSQKELTKAGRQGQGQEEVTRAISAVAEYNARLGAELGVENRAIGQQEKDFSDVVLGMIESLQEIEDKGDEMVKKIDVQEEHFDTLKKEIEAKETYIAAIDRKIKVNEAIHSEMVETLRKMEENKTEKDEQTKMNTRKIKAQEKRLQRLLKDITTKVNYVQVIDAKVNEMENITREAAKDLFQTKQRRDSLSADLKKLELNKASLEKEMRDYTQLVKSKRQKKIDESRQFEMEVKLYNETIEKMAGALETYKARIAEANVTLSSLEKAAKDNDPTPVALIESSSDLWPALAISLAANFAMGGVLLGAFDVPKGLLQLDPVYEYEEYDTEGVDVQVGGEVDPLLALARVKEEREKVFGKKSNFLRRRGLDPYAGM